MSIFLRCCDRHVTATGWNDLINTCTLFYSTPPDRSTIWKGRGQPFFSSFLKEKEFRFFSCFLMGARGHVWRCLDHSRSHWKAIKRKTIPLLINVRLERDGIQKKLEYSLPVAFYLPTHFGAKSRRITSKRKRGNKKKTNWKVLRRYKWNGDRE